MSEKTYDLNELKQQYHAARVRAGRATRLVEGVDAFAEMADAGHKLIVALDSDLTAAQEQIKQLLEALKPFADLWTEGKKTRWQRFHDDLVIYAINSVEVLASDYRRAAALYHQIKDQDHG